MLKNVLENLKDIDLILLAVCNYTNDDCKTDIEEIVKSLDQDNVYCAYFKKMEQKDLFNKCVKRLKQLGAKVILINDADEILLKKDRDFIVNGMLENEFDFDAIHCSVIDYSKMDCSEMFEMRTHKPVVAIKPVSVFDGNRSVGSGKTFENITLHHFGYAMDESNLNWKMNNLWYKRGSANAILSSKKLAVNPPQELIGRMK
jgi:hypothetical protein